MPRKLDKVVGRRGRISRGRVKRLAARTSEARNEIAFQSAAVAEALADGRSGRYRRLAGVNSRGQLEHRTNANPVAVAAEDIAIKPAYLGETISVAEFAFGNLDHGVARPDYDCVCECGTERSERKARANYVS